MNKPEKRLYPSWRFGPGGKSLIVNDPDEEKALGVGWFKSPAEAEKATAKPQPKEAAAASSKPAASGKPKKTK